MTWSARAAALRCGSESVDAVDKVPSFGARDAARRSSSAVVGKLRRFMRNRIFGAIGVLWGGAILVRTYFIGGPAGTGAYRNGQIAALVFAALLVLVGGYYLIRGNGRAKS
jgi:hypothetical protein